MSSFTAVFVATLAVLATHSSPVASLTRQPVDLGSAERFAILSKSGITDVSPSAIVGDAGSSPITGAAIHLTCSEVTGDIFSVDAAGPACVKTSASMLTQAVSDMEAAYDDAAGRLLPDGQDVNGGALGGESLPPGLYNWGSSVTINSTLTLTGVSPTDVYIFQVAGDVLQQGDTQVVKADTLDASNIFWQVAGLAEMGENAHFEGIILSKTGINMKTHATINGRLLAQTAVTLQKNDVTEPNDA